MSKIQNPVQSLAEALQHCLDHAADKGAERAVEMLAPRLDSQDETLRLMWKQMKGNGKLPIDP